jgi:hypothetical protein
MLRRLKFYTALGCIGTQSHQHAIPENMDFGIDTICNDMPHILFLLIEDTHLGRIWFDRQLEKNPEPRILEFVLSTWVAALSQC